MSRFLIDIQNATVYRGEKPALRSISWRMKHNENWAIVGNNGSGKTTLLKLIFGELLPVDGGSVHWFSSRVWRGLAELRDRIGFVSAEFQESYDQNMKAVDVVSSGFFSSIGLWEKVTGAQKTQATKEMQQLGIHHLAGERIFNLSYGERRRVLLARALVTRPTLLVLDEPCAGLDIPTREQFLDTLSRLKGTRMVYVTHHVEEILPEITNVMLLKKGKIHAQGIKSEMLTSRVLTGALGCRIRVTQENNRTWLTGSSA